MPQKMLYWIGKRTVDFMARVMLDLNILYHEEFPPGPKIIAPNHPTTLDPFIITIISPDPLHVLVTESAFKAPILGEYLRQAGHVPVVSSDGRQAFNAARDLLEQGLSVAIFPEGGLSPDGRVLRPHTGVTRLALATGAPIIPVGIALDTTRIHLLDTGIQGPDGTNEVARLYHGGPYFITAGIPMRLSGDVEDRALVSAQTQKIMRHIVRLSKMSNLRIQGQEIPKTAVETNAIGAVSIHFEIPT